MIKALILDVDGVVVVGQSAIPGANGVVRKLRKMGYKIFYLTNNSNRSRRTMIEKFRKLGLDAYPGEIYPVSYAAAQYVKEHHPKASVYTIAGEGIDEELGIAGVRIDGWKDAGYVIAGLDKHIDYRRFSEAFRAIMRGARFLATNDDKSFPAEDGLYPGAAIIVGGLQYATGKKPIIIGKPNTYMISRILKENGLRKDEVLVVGDRLDTDIRMARNAGIRSVLVTGSKTNGSRKELLEGAKKDRPTLMIEHIRELPAALAKRF